MTRRGPAVQKSTCRMQVRGSLGQSGTSCLPREKRERGAFSFLLSVLLMPLTLSTEQTNPHHRLQERRRCCLGLFLSRYLDRTPQPPHSRSRPRQHPSAEVPSRSWSDYERGRSLFAPFLDRFRLLPLRPPSSCLFRIDSHLEPPPSLYTPSAPIASSITSPSPVSLIASLQTLVTSSFPPPPPPLFISTPPSTFIRTSPRRSPTSPALPSTAAHPSLTSEREDDFSPTQRIDLSPQLDSTVLPLVQELGYSLIEVSSTRTLRQTDRRRMAARRTTSGSPPMLLKQVEKSRGGSERA
jgi:hypothetical protein